MLELEDILAKHATVGVVLGAATAFIATAVAPAYYLDSDSTFMYGVSVALGVGLASTVGTTVGAIVGAGTGLVTGATHAGINAARSLVSNYQYRKR